MSIEVIEHIEYSVTATISRLLTDSEIEQLWEFSTGSRDDNLKVENGKTVIECYNFESEGCAEELKEYLEELENSC